MSITASELVRPSFTEWHATVIGPTGVSVGESAAAAYRELASAMRAAGVESFQEKVYCAAGSRDELEAARRAALERRGIEHTTPWAHVRGRDDGGSNASAVCVQLWGVTRRSTDVRVSTLASGRHRGRLVEGPGVRMLWLASIDGSDVHGALPPGIAAQAESMFGSAEHALASAGFSFRDVARTWIYARELLASYRAINGVRTAFYAARGIGSRSDARHFPASTGIQGRANDEECMMDLLAIRTAGLDARVTPLERSDRQGPAFAYGSSFSRAVSVELEGRQTLLVSGTSSIGPDGGTLHPNDPERQSVETLLGLAALIRPLGATLADVATGTLFTRDADALAAFDRAAGSMRLPALPLVRVYADVCRPDLTVEIEAIVHVPTAVAPPGVRR